MEALITVWIAAIGLSIGSFLNVVIARLPDPKRGTPEYAALEAKVEALPEPVGWWQRWLFTLRLSGWAYQRLVWPRSRCPKCGHQLAWYENIPVVSWVMLRGKCSSCRTPISPRYVFVELVTGTLFVVAITRYGFDWRLVSALVFFTFLIPLIFIDAEHWLLPFELTLPAIAAGLLLALPSGKDAFFIALEGAVAGFLLFRVMEFFGWLATGREALGAGDKYLLAMIGAQVGWRGLLGVILLSSVQGAVVGLVRMRLTGRAGPAPAEPKKDEPTTEEPKTEEPKTEEPKTEEPKADEPQAEAPKVEAPPVVPSEPKPEGDSAVQENAPAEEDDEEAPKRDPFTPEFVKPGLRWWQRLLAIPFTIFLQDIPDSPPPDETTGEVPDWEPQANNIPFGPWIGLAGIEVMLLGPFFVERLAHTQWRLLSEVVFGL